MITKELSGRTMVGETKETNRLFAEKSAKNKESKEEKA